MTTFFPSAQEWHLTQHGSVAIITRTKNRPILLARAFASVLAQTYQNWHLYLVNDGGEAEPVNQLVQHYETAFDGRISIIHHPQSLGMEAASNAALTSAAGDFVVIHDDDDAWSPTYLEETVTFLETKQNCKFAAVASNCTVINEEIFHDVVIEKERFTWGYWKERVDFMDQFCTNTFPPICLLIRKEVVDKIGLYNAKLPVLGDWDYNLRILLVGDIGTINKPLAYYHHRIQAGTSIYGNSVTSGYNVHHDYQVLYRNSMLRMLLEKEPGYAGLLHVLLNRINNLEQKISEIQGGHYPANSGMANADVVRILLQLEQFLKPFKWLWRRILPLRGFFSRFRR